MLIKRKSPRTGIVNSMELDVTQEEIDRWQEGEYIQNAMPRLSADEREFVKTGYTKEDWDAIFPPEEEADA
jgi:hypothetical protein